MAHSAGGNANSAFPPFCIRPAFPCHGGGTKPWYYLYQAVVLLVPSRGITCTKPWYHLYHAVVFLRTTQTARNNSPPGSQASRLHCLSLRAVETWLAPAATAAPVFRQLHASAVETRLATSSQVNLHIVRRGKSHLRKKEHTQNIPHVMLSAAKHLTRKRFLHCARNGSLLVGILRSLALPLNDGTAEWGLPRITKESKRIIRRGLPRLRNKPTPLHVMLSAAKHLLC